MNHSKFLIVVGPHRSGSTWIGQCLASGYCGFYIDEPFHINRRAGLFNYDINDWYVNADEVEKPNLFYDAFLDVLSMRYNWFAEATRIRSVKDLGRMCRDGFKVTKARSTGCLPVVKDPFALFSIDWLRARFPLCVVVLARHPAAFVSSIIKKNWEFDFENFRYLLPVLPKDISDKLLQHIAQREDILSQACLLWEIIHDQILKLRSENTDDYFIRYEDFVADPVGASKSIVTHFNLPECIIDAGFIERSSSSTNSKTQYQVGVYGKRDSIYRDSKSAMNEWRERLSDSQVNYIRTETEQLARKFDYEW